ncbi:MAG: hypothetical protein OEO77_10225 [Acidimicrobiia bacterium]|nr:hypothetical protein [Acidimicrobiia bacterium]
MAQNPDPKPGRWILPLIILGMVGFTYVFVQSLQDRVEANPDLTTPAISTTTTLVDTITTTTLPAVGVLPDAETQAYLDGVEAWRASLAALDLEMTAINSDWDNRAIEYAAARDSIRDDLNPRINEFATTVADGLPPAANTVLTSLHDQLAAAASATADAAAGVLAGLQSSDTGEARAAALDEFATAVAAFNTAADSIAATAP